MGYLLATTLRKQNPLCLFILLVPEMINKGCFFVNDSRPIVTLKLGSNDKARKHKDHNNIYEKYVKVKFS